jgi:flagellar motility protein MotE (MotC chaperone)
MARKLKVFQTSQGFFDLAIAAPSMKAALEAWGASSNFFHQGFAKEEAKAAKAREKRNAAVEKAQTALLQAEAEHEEKADALSKDMEAVQRRVEAEEERWRTHKGRLEADLQKAKD